MQAAVIKAYIRNGIELMPDSQPPSFSYTDAQLETLTTYISLERLRMYIAAIRNFTDSTDRLRRALKLYEKNTAYCEALYTVMQGFEVTFRNAIHNRLSADLGSEWWFEQFAFLDVEREAIVRAKVTIERKPQKVTADRVVAELTFGFWVRLFSGDYADTMWGPSLKHIVPSGFERGIVYARFKDLKTLRNRIAHHNRIIGRHNVTAKQLYEQTMETIGWLDRTVHDWVAETNSFYPKYCKPVFDRSPLRPSSRT